MRKHIKIICLLMGGLITLVGCQSDNINNTVLTPYTDDNAYVQVINDDGGQINRNLYENVKIQDAEDIFIKKGYPPFIPSQTGKKSIGENNTIIYLNTNDNINVSSIMFRVIIAHDEFTKDTISSGVNDVSDMMVVVLNRELTIDERKDIRAIYGGLIESNTTNDEDISEVISIDGVEFTLKIEPLSKTVMCSYSVV